MNHLRIPSPCSANWQHMTPAEAGRHCAACEKVVVDFASMTDAQVLTYFAEPRREKTCGRFRVSQLDRPLGDILPAPSWATWLAAAAVALSSCETAPTSSEPPLLQGAVNSAVFEVNGQIVVRTTGKPLAGASITSLRDTSYHAITDSNGRFILKLPPELRGTRLLASYVSFPMMCLAHIATADAQVQVALQPMPDEPIALGRVKISSYPGYQPGDTLPVPTVPPLPPPMPSMIEFTPPKAPSSAAK